MQQSSSYQNLLCHHFKSTVADIIVCKLREDLYISDGLKII